MGRRILTVSLDLVLPALCRDDRKLPLGRVGEFITCDGIPGDARIVAVSPNAAFTGQLDLLLESAEWATDPPGVLPTRVYPLLTVYVSHAAYLEVMAEKEKDGPAEPKAAEGDQPAVADPVRFREFL